MVVMDSRLFPIVSWPDREILLQFNYLYSASQLTLIWKAETIKDSDFEALGILQYVKEWH